MINDGCSDRGHWSVSSRYSSKITYLKQSNQGLAAARDTAIRAAKAPLLALLDGDDVWEPTCREG